MLISDALVPTARSNAFHQPELTVILSLSQQTQKCSSTPPLYFQLFTSCLFAPLSPYSMAVRPALYFLPLSRPLSFPSACLSSTSLCLVSLPTFLLLVCLSSSHILLCLSTSLLLLLSVVSVMSTSTFCSLVAFRVQGNDETTHSCSGELKAQRKKRRGEEVADEGGEEEVEEEKEEW